MISVMTRNLPSLVLANEMTTVEGLSTVGTLEVYSSLRLTLMAV